MKLVDELKALPSLVNQSSKEFKKTKTIVGAGLFSGLHVLLSTYAEFYIIPNVLKISFAFVAYAACGFMYGPMVAGIYGAVLDILTFLVKPDGTFFIGYTLSAFVTGFIYGACLYKKKVTLQRCFVTKLLINLIINLFFTPLWLYIMGYGSAVIFFSSSRIIKNIVLLPVESGILYTFLKFVDKNLKRM